MAAPGAKAFTKTQKIAALLITIGTDAAAEVLKHFERPQVETICREMEAIDFVEPARQKELLAEFSDLLKSVSGAARGGASFAHEALERSGGGAADAAAGRKAGALNLGQMEAQQIFRLIKTEQPQTLAFIVSCLDAMKSAAVLMLLPAEVRAEVIERLGGMEPVPHDVLDKVTRRLTRDVDPRLLQRGMTSAGGVKPVAGILKAVDKDTRKQLIEGIEGRNPPLGLAVRNELFGFEDLVRLDATDLQRVLREIDMGDLVVALKTAKPALLTAVTKAMSSRAAEGLKDDMDMLGVQKPKEIEAAQDRIVQVVRRLEEEEQITLDNGGGANGAV